MERFGTTELVPDMAAAISALMSDLVDTRDEEGRLEYRTAQMIRILKCRSSEEVAKALHEACYDVEEFTYDEFVAQVWPERHEGNLFSLSCAVRKVFVS